jgi:hypothetical protein
MAATAATRTRSTKPKPEPVEAPVAGDDNLTNVTDDKGKKLTVQQLKNKLRNEAEREVLDTHKDEVIKITAAKYKVHNLEYVRRLSEEEKAAKAIEEYYVRFPNLRPQVEQQQLQFEETIVVTPEQHPRLVVAEEGGALEAFRGEDHDVEPEPSEYPEESEPPFGYDRDSYGQGDDEK